MSERKLCPFAALGTAECSKSCALWLEGHEKCAIAVIAEALDGIYRMLSLNSLRRRG